MLKSLKYTIKLLLILLSVQSSLKTSAYAQSMPAKTIPDFTFYKMKGQPFSRKDLSKSRKAVIVFFDVTCDHCQKELKAMSTQIEGFKNAEVYLISMDNVPGIQKFMEKFAPKMNGRSNVTLLTDLHRQFITRFMPVQYPATFVYGPDWRLIKYYGQNSKISDIIRTVNK